MDLDFSGLLYAGVAIGVVLAGALGGIWWLAHHIRFAFV